MANRTSKSSLRNNIIISFFLVIAIWGMIVTSIFQKQLHSILANEELSKEIIYNINRQFVAVSTGVTLIGIVVVFGIGFLLSNKITRPLKKLSNGLIEISAGNLNHVLDINSNDEFGQLAYYFEKMTRDLKSSTTSIDLLNKEIDERKQTEKKLLLTKFTVDQAADMIFRIARNGSFVYTNKAAYQRLGYSQKEMLSLKVWDADPNFPQKRWDKLWNEVQQKKTMTFESTHLTKNEETFPVEVTVYIFQFEQEEYICAFVRDISERKQTEEMLKQAKTDAELANHIKSRFLANMSHEIRTPLNAIRGFCDLLNEEELNQTQTQYVQTIKSSGDHLLEIINDILDVSKIEEGKLDLEIINCSPQKLIDDVHATLIPLAQKKNIELAVNKIDALPKFIQTDPIRLQQCLLNLLNNGIKFTQEGHVFLNIKMIQENNKEFIQFDVVDTGTGISPDKIKDIFESFSQADSSTTRKFGGTGLGLTITKKLTEMLDGTIEVKSILGEGSKFTLKIPTNVESVELEETQYELETKASQTTEDKFTGKILVAEDAEANQLLIKILLNKLGLEVTLVENGKQAVQQALENEFNLIFMDIQMPEMNGFQATEILVKEKKIQTPIVALTANAMKGDRKKCLDAGCTDYLSKPIDPDQLKNVLHKYLTKTASNSIKRSA